MAPRKPAPGGKPKRPAPKRLAKVKSTGKVKRTRKPPAPTGFSEVRPTGLFVPAEPLARIFEDYGNACAFTGRDLRAEGAADPRGYLLNISADPQTLDPTRLIPACLDAIHAYERGYLALGPRYNFLVDLETIDPEFLLTLNPLGRLSLPADPASRPAQAALAGHLIAFLRGRPGA